MKSPGLLGEFQRQNAAAVLMLLEVAGLGASVDPALINQVLPGLTLTGRLQRVTPDLSEDVANEWLIDVAHNPTNRIDRQQMWSTHESRERT